MTGRKSLLAPLAVALVAAAITAPAAFAYTEPSFPGGSADSQAAQPTKVRVVEVPTDSGFEWGDAAIGAGGSMALVLVGLGAAMAIISGRARHPVADRRATPSAP